MPFDGNILTAAFLAGFSIVPLAYFSYLGHKREMADGEPPPWMIVMFLAMFGAMGAGLLIESLPLFLRIYLVMTEIVLLGGCMAYLALSWLLTRRQRRK